MFNGSLVALITPFRDGSVDKTALRQLVKFHLEQGTHGLVPVGATGESAILTMKEHRSVVEVVVHEVGGEIPVIAGAGSNNPVEAIALSQDAEQCGVDATLHVAGYYNRPSQEGIYQHFAVVHDAIEKPILAYNLPRRTIVDIQPETMRRIAELPEVVGVKDATCDLTRPLLEAQTNRPFCLLSGEDALAVAYNVHGGQGCISVPANVAPSLCSQMQSACAEGDFASALQIQKRLLPLHQILFEEPSPAGVKFACSLLGLTTDTCRLPIVPLDGSTKERIREVMTELE